MAQIGTIKLQTQNNGTVSVPVFNTGDSGSSVYEFVRVQTAGGTGFIPVVDPADASFPYLRVQSQNQGVVAVHNDSSLTTIVDNFEASLYEDQNNTLSTYYSGDDLANFERQTSTVVEGSYSLRCIAQGGYYGIDSQQTAGLPKYPEPGDTIKLRMLITATDDEDFRFGWGYQDSNNYYTINISPNQGRYELEVREGGNTSNLDSVSMSFTSNIWYRVTINWGTSGSLSTTLEEPDGTQVASLSGNNSSFTDGGIYFLATARGGINNDVYWDNVRIV